MKAIFILLSLSLATVPTNALVIPVNTIPRVDKQIKHSLPTENTPSLDQTNGTSADDLFGVPISVLYDFLNIPLLENDEGYEVLIIGGIVPQNYADNENFNGRLDIRYVDTPEERSAYTNNSEPVHIIEYIMDKEYSIFNNIRLTWVSVRFDEMSVNSEYVSKVADFVDDVGQEKRDVLDAIAVCGEYFGNPLDEFNQVLDNFNERNRILLGRAEVKQPGGDLLSPASNPNMIAIGNLESDGEYLKAFSDPSLFKVVQQSAVAPNDYVRSNPDFVVPGNSITLINTSLYVNPTNNVQMVSSKYLPVITFMMGYFSLLSSIGGESQEILRGIIDNTVSLPAGSYVGTQIGYGIPSFQEHKAGQTLIRSVTLNPYDTNKTQVDVTEGQVLNAIIEVNPYFDDIVLDKVMVSYDRDTITDEQNTTAQKIFADDLITTRFKYGWRHPLMIERPLTITGIPDDAEFQITFVLDFDGQVLKITKSMLMDNNRKLLAIPTYLDLDGIYNWQNPVGKFYPTLKGLVDTGWAISLLTNRELFMSEIENLRQDVIAVIDPDIHLDIDASAYLEYIENGGNIVFMLDYQRSTELPSVQGNPLMQYEAVAFNFTEWLEDINFPVYFWDHREINSLISVREQGVPENQEPFYYLPWYGINNSYIKNFTLVPYRGYGIAYNSSFDYYVKTYNANLGNDETLIPYALKYMGEGSFSILGTNSMFVESFTTPEVPIRFTEQVDWLDNLMTISSGTIGEIKAEVSSSPNVINKFEIQLHAMTMTNHQKDRWKIQVAGDYLPTKSYAIEIKSITIRPSIRIQGNMNVNIFLVFNNHIIDQTTVEVNLGRDKLVLYTISAVWGAIIFLVMIIYVLKRREMKRLDRI